MKPRAIVRMYPAAGPAMDQGEWKLGQLALVVKRPFVFEEMAKVESF